MNRRKLYYIAFLLISSFLSILKITLYSAYIGPEEFGVFSKAYVVSAVFALVASFGLASIAHRELPSLFISKKYESIRLMNVATKNTIFFNGFALILLSFFISLVSGENYNIFVLGIIHGMFTGLFFQDLLLIKSKLKFNEYGKKLLLRTITIMLAGLLMLTFHKSALYILVAECLVLVLLQIRYLIRRFKSPIKVEECKKSIKRFLKNRKLIILTLVSTGFVHGDKWVASILLNAEDFGIYSFYWILISVGLNLQQVLNIRIFTESALLKKQNESLAYKKLIKFSLLSATTLLFLSPIGYYITVFVITNWFVEYSENVEVFVSIAYLLMIVRASDFISNIGLIFKYEIYQVRIFILGSLVFVFSVLITTKLDIGLHLNQAIFMIATLTSLMSLILLSAVVHKRIKINDK